jgi:tetratricopeptide (TPR) repeat protein
LSRRVAFASFLLAYGLLILPFTGFLTNRPMEVKLGYLPHPQLLKILTADHGLLFAEMTVVKVLFYYGTIVGKFQENVIIRPEHANMYRTLQTATQLDPYNMDAYYFAQAAFTWELRRIAEVNALLEYGIKYRTWDPWMYFYLGFNNAYFLKDYGNAARYLQRAGELAPENALFARLSARYYYESDQTALGLSFLETLIAQAKDGAVKQTYTVRRDALLAVLTLEKAQSSYILTMGHQPRSLQELIQTGFLQQIPDDPYGGTFYLDEKNRVRSTSKLASPNL